MLSLDYNSYYTYARACYSGNPNSDLNSDDLNSGKPTCYKFQFAFQPTEEKYNVISKSIPIHLPVNYPDYLDTIDILNDMFEEQIKDPLNVDNVTDTLSFKTVNDHQQFTEHIEIISELIIPELEKQLYGCHLQLSRFYIYQNKFTPNEADELNTNIWHWDNQPETMINVIIYLEDIGQFNSHLQILEKDGLAITMPTNRTGIRNWGQKTHMRYKKCQLNGTHEREFMYYGFKQTSLLGPRGSCCVLSKNIIHRHNLVAGSTSNMLCLQLKPVHEWQNNFVTEKTKTLFDLEVDPSPL